MITIQPTPPGKDQAEQDLFTAEQPVPAPTTTDLAGQMPVRTFAAHLRAAREARGLGIDACAHAVRLPVHVLRKLEQGETDSLDSKVYLASYIASYGRFLGIADAEIASEQASLRQVEAPLVASGGISHSRFLFDRYATAATYLVFTLAIAVPTIWFGVRSTLDRDFTHLAPLDASPVAQQDTRPVVPVQHTGSASTPVAVATQARPATAQAPSEQPLMASMAPFPSLGDDNASAAPAATDTANGPALGLALSAPSWVEVIQQDGTRLEYGLMPAGTSKTWHSEQPLDVRIGNAQGAQVTLDGQALALDAFRRANVAHFRVQVENGKADASAL